MPSTKTKGNNHKAKKETEAALKKTAPVEIANEVEAPAASPQEVTPPATLDYEFLVVKQPETVNGHLTKEDRKQLKTVLLWKHPYNLGGGIVKTQLVPGQDQRPYYYLDKIAGFGLKWRFNSLLYGGDKVREPVYLMQEWYVDDQFKPGPYEPGPLTPATLTPARCFHLMDWSRFKAYILHKAVGWKDLVKVGVIVLAIIVALIIFFMAWRANITPRPVIEQPANTTLTVPPIGAK